MPLDQDAVDITKSAAVTAMLARQTPDLVINLAAYTTVDRAESEPEAAWERLNKVWREENGDRKFVKLVRGECPLSWADLVIDVRVFGASRAVYAAEQRNR